jgi:hypothetical protein
MDLHSVNALRNLGHIFDQLSFNKEDVSNEFSDLKQSCEKLLVEKRQQSKLERQRTKRGRNDLRRIDLGAKRLGANRLGGETTGYHIEPRGFEPRTILSPGPDTILSPVVLSPGPY